jgi:hypothetical protein
MWNGTHGRDILGGVGRYKVHQGTCMQGSVQEPFLEQKLLPVLKSKEERGI